MSLPNPQLRKLKALGQRLEPMLKVGKAGVSGGFLNQLDGILTAHELVKIKFDEFKEEKKQLAKEIAEKSSSELVHQVGHVIVLFRQHPDPQHRKIQF